MKPKAVDFHLSRIYWRVWWRLAKLRFTEQIINTRFSGLFFIVGKITRLLFQVAFLYLLLRQVKLFAGYDFYQSLLILFLLNFLSSLIQMFFRGAYHFRFNLINGFFDFFLVTPLDELFYSLLSYFDPLDALLLPFSLGAVIWAWCRSGLAFNFANLFFFLFFLALALAFALAWHIVALALGLRFFVVDNFILLYRDLEKMVRFPLEIYSHFLRWLLTYVFSVAVLAPLPVAVLFGKRSPWPLLPILFFLAVFQLLLAWRFWRFSLRLYSSASS